jgi:hypothetical protein
VQGLPLSILLLALAAAQKGCPSQLESAKVCCRKKLSKRMMIEGDQAQQLLKIETVKGQHFAERAPRQLQFLSSQILEVDKKLLVRLHRDMLLHA